MFHHVRQAAGGCSFPYENNHFPNPQALMVRGVAVTSSKRMFLEGLRGFFQVPYTTFLMDFWKQTIRQRTKNTPFFSQLFKSSSSSRMWKFPMFFYMGVS